MTIQEDIQKIIQETRVEEFRKRVLKKRSLSRKLDDDLDPHYWENIKNQLTEPLAKQLVDTFKGLGDQVVEYDERVDQILELLGYKEKTPDFEGVVKDATKPSDKTYWTKLAEKFAHSARDNNTWRDLEDLINIVVNVKKHLGISDDELDQLTVNTGLAMPIKKVGGVNTSLTLKETIEICNALLPHLTPNRSLKKLIDEANRYQSLNIVANNAIREKEEIDQKKISALNFDLDTAKNALKKWTDKFPPGKTPDQVEREIKDLQSRPTTGSSGTGTSSSADKQKIADLIKLIEKQNQAIRKYGDAQDNYTGDYSWKAEIIDVSKLKN